MLLGAAGLFRLLLFLMILRIRLYHTEMKGTLSMRFPVNLRLNGVRFRLLIQYGKC